MGAYYTEARTLPPPEDFKQHALVVGPEMYDQAEQDYQGFWARQAADLVTWFEDWDTICDWNLPFAKWFVGGKLNVPYNCLDRHVEAGRGVKVAFPSEGQHGNSGTSTHPRHHTRDCKFPIVPKDPRPHQGR